MNILLWILQFVVALYCVLGAVWRMINYHQAAPQIASLGALSVGTWGAIGLFEMACAAGLLLPGLLKGATILTPIAAAALVAEMLLLTMFHARFFGMTAAATNPAMWTLGLAIVAAIIAIGRFAVRPL